MITFVDKQYCKIIFFSFEINKLQMEAYNNKSTYGW